MIFRSKFVALIILLTVIGVNSEKDISVEEIKLENNSYITENKSPSKRGVFYNGHGLSEAYNSFYGYQIPSVAGQFLSKPLLSGSRPLTFSAPAGFGSSIHYANSPLFNNENSPLHTHPGPIHFNAPTNTIAGIPQVAPAQYAIRPGGAVVQSYSVNYPQLHYHQRHFPSYAVAPASAPVPISAGIAPANPFVPVNNVHYSAFASSPAHFGITFPPPAIAAVPLPSVTPSTPQHFFVNRPPAIGIQYASAPVPPEIPFVSHRPTFISFASPPPAVSQFPSVIPIGSGSAIATGHLPLATPVTPTIPTTVSTPWRPIIINNIPTTAATPQPAGSAANRPPISLLPPYGLSERPNNDYNYYHPQSSLNQQELTEQNYYEDHVHKGYHY